MRLKRTGILTKIVLLILIAYAAVTLVRLGSKIEKAKSDQAELEKTVASMAAENDDMQYAIEHSEDEDVIKDIARDKLDLVEPGEEVYYAG